MADQEIEQAVKDALIKSLDPAVDADAFKLLKDKIDTLRELGAVG